MKNTNNIPWEAITQKLRGEGDPLTGRILDEWLASDENNRKLFAELSGLWDDIRARASAIDPDKEELWDELRRRTVAKTRKRQLVRNNVLWGAASFAAASLMFGAVWFFQLRPEEPRRELATQTIENITGKSRASMPDGSRVWLHDNTYITYDSDYGLGARNISLHGEAFFDVEHDPENPFTVSVNGLKVTVLGTRFNVRSCSGGEKVMVGLLEGEVELSAGDVSCRMTPGKTALYDKNTRTISVEEGDLFFESLWMNDRLQISNRSLGEICRYLERWYNISITVDPAAANAYSYSFTITEEPLEEILRIMNRINPISYRFVEGRGVIISRR